MGRQKLIYFHYEVERQRHILRLRQRALEAQQRDPWDGGGPRGPYNGGTPLPTPAEPEEDGDEDVRAA